MKTIRQRLALTIGFIILITACIGLIGIYFIIDDNEEEYISEDIGQIAEFSKNYIYTDEVLGTEKDDFNIVKTINNLFNVYASIDSGSDTVSMGKLILNKDIEDLKMCEDKTKSKLKLYRKDNLMIGTLYQPIYIDGKFYCRLIVQKDYSKVYKLNKSILISIGIILMLMTIILMAFVYLIIKKTTKPLESLTSSMRRFGRGEEVKPLEVKYNDEVGVLTEEFNEMKENISSLQDASKTFFNNATHELKTPLTVIRGYTQLLHEEEFEDKDIVKMLNNIEDETVRMNNLIQKNLTLSKSEMILNKEKEEINLKNEIEDILKIFDVIIRENEYKINLNLENINIFGIKEDIRTLISNLIDNAIKYSEGNEININLTDNKELIISNKYKNIESNIKNRLLDPFIKGNTKQHVNGTGLGLYLCKKISEKNNFKLTYKINEDKIIFIIKF
ncbi:sensor histidine kinase [Clostridium sardiniense]|uniref:sensor histidine kinase n=1 Tax=Clostridium sardiniense TaxID=29369 RepID=UPI00195C73DF|nr:HAMP domain-containing sensor histidine kinase [Clostridium sardiniense]MBM7834822.1 signal transduction histidine kinase [Clostridium sardiniense]